jgi:L-alanine-DL-glutamate epimerase-like enolase superfamily enzyme
VQFASRTKNLGPAMEHTWRQPQRPYSWFKPDYTVRNGRLLVPDMPGMGIEIDEDYLAGAEVLAAVKA